MSEAKLREAICRFGKSLYDRGLTPGSSGNISVRLDDGGWLVTPTNASLGHLDGSVMVLLGNWAGNHAFGKVSDAAWRIFTGAVLGVSALAALWRLLQA